jgi:hypothetical protein
MRSKFDLLKSRPMAIGLQMELSFASELTNSQRKVWFLKKQLGRYNGAIAAFISQYPTHPRSAIFLAIRDSEHSRQDGSWT